MRLAIRFAADLTGFGQVGVVGGGLHLGMPEQLADHGPALADQQAAAGEAVTKVMDTHVLKTGALADAPPGVLQVRQMPADVVQLLRIVFAN